MKKIEQVGAGYDIFISTMKKEGLLLGDIYKIQKAVKKELIPCFKGNQNIDELYFRLNLYITNINIEKAIKKYASNLMDDMIFYKSIT